MHTCITFELETQEAIDTRFATEKFDLADDMKLNAAIVKLLQIKQCHKVTFDTIKPQFVGLVVQVNLE